LDFQERFRDQQLCFLHSSLQNPCFGHFGHIRDDADVWLFQFYPASGRCHGSRNAETLQGNGCCL
jgi:hypothetical protein